MKKYFLFLLVFQLFVKSSSIFSMVDPIEEKSNKTVIELYSDKTLFELKNHKTRLEYISGKFLGHPYFLNALGDGIESPYDQFPFYRLDVFDCETYVSTMLSLAFAQNSIEFKKMMHRIRYINDKNKPSYFGRNHFPEVDWNVNNTKNGFVKDITTHILNQQGQPIYHIANTVIDRPAWVQQMTEKTLRLRSENQNVLPQRLLALKQEGKNLQRERSNLPYIPIVSINDAILLQIPNASIIEIVRPDWDVKAWMGTNVNVSHMGLVFWKNGTLMFREASSVFMKVVDVPLMDYLHEQAIRNPSVKGIHVQAIN